MTDVSESYLESLRESVSTNASALTAEQREHDITRRQRDTLQTQCEDMQSEMETERKINNAALKPSGNEIVMDAIKTRDDVIEALELTQAALCTEVSKLAGYKVELESSAETQAIHMQQLDTACKSAEAKVIEQRKEIEALTMCADRCAICESTQLEEITNRDALILQQESRAEDREEIIKALANEIEMRRQGEIVATGSDGGQSRCGDESALTIGKFKIAFSGKREGMVKPGAHTRLLRNGDIVTVNPVITIRDV